MRKVFVWVTALLLAAVLVQFYFAAFGVFQEPATDEQFRLHQVNGRIVLPVLCLLVIAAAAAARAPGRLIAFSALPLGLLFLQVGLFFIAAITGSTETRTTVGGQLVLGLHALNGLTILGVTLVLLRRARAFAATPRRGSSTEAPADRQPIGS